MWTAEQEAKYREHGGTPPLARCNAVCDIEAIFAGVSDAETYEQAANYLRDHGAELIKAIAPFCEAAPEPEPEEPADCPECDGTGGVDDPARCLRCGMVGCGTIDCSACGGTGKARTGTGGE